MGEMSTVVSIKAFQVSGNQQWENNQVKIPIRIGTIFQIERDRFNDLPYKNWGQYKLFVVNLMGTHYETWTWNVAFPAEKQEASDLVHSE